MGIIRGKSSRPTADSAPTKGGSLSVAYSARRNTKGRSFKTEKRADEDSSDSREMDMLDGHSTEGDSELSFLEKQMRSISGEHDKREEKMLDGHPRRHSAEKRAASSMPTADDMDSMEDKMMFAKGGPVEKPKSIAEAIRRKRASTMDSEADLNRNADEDLNYEDQLSFDAGRKQSYSEEAGLDMMGSPEDSNEHGHDLSDEDEHGMSMIARIRAKAKAMRK